MDKLWRVSSSPHILDRDSVPKIMRAVVLALLPALGGALYFFGIRALWVTLVAVVTAVVTEYLIEKLLNKPVTIKDWSAVVTGMLLAYNLPPEVPLWIPIIGSVFAIAIVKQAFGGLGFNPVNPALAARALLLASWPIHVTVFNTPPRGGTLSGIDIITSATPLNVMKQSLQVLKNVDAYSIDKVNKASEAIIQLHASYGNLFWGKVGGCIGETSAFLLLLGAAFLLYRHIIGWHIPLSYIATVAVLTWIFGGSNGLFSGDPTFHVLAGGLILGAFFMATDMVTSPLTPKACIWFGIGCGVITTVIRLIGGYPEGVSYSILLMNLVTPLLNRLRPKAFGERK
ncbi:Na+-transporting NADH:ubiquinone oxidoreductase subunit D [candidate division KSB1 bacterium]|nr:RnfABCDGE type electron transport complex subunit D [bacterium]RKY79262.1 MAG: Na+-transporting NADH:ubiquinone oxidoreductase subunit D [candidate division KSB1 bacterium]RKY81762.1 MAG: Na+-transporting NADH:ubiquinone oxidoreductase subunit D [candidate division KSB1 bacterium]HDI52157.1 RnfABCDGE type electron transport complex subunit D [Bacteroidota bacterium]